MSAARRAPCFFLPALRCPPSPPTGAFCCSIGSPPRRRLGALPHPLQGDAPLESPRRCLAPLPLLSAPLCSLHLDPFLHTPSITLPPPKRTLLSELPRIRFDSPLPCTALSPLRVLLRWQRRATYPLPLLCPCRSWRCSDSVVPAAPPLPVPSVPSPFLPPLASSAPTAPGHSWRSAVPQCRVPPPDPLVP